MAQRRPPHAVLRRGHGRRRGRAIRARQDGPAVARVAVGLRARRECLAGSRWAPSRPPSSIPVGPGTFGVVYFWAGLDVVAGRRALRVRRAPPRRLGEARRLALGVGSILAITGMDRLELTTRGNPTSFLPALADRHRPERRRLDRPRALAGHPGASRPASRSALAERRHRERDVERRRPDADPALAGVRRLGRDAPGRRPLGRPEHEPEHAAGRSPRPAWADASGRIGRRLRSAKRRSSLHSGRTLDPPATYRPAGELRRGQRQIGRAVLGLAVDVLLPVGDRRADALGWRAGTIALA